MKKKESPLTSKDVKERRVRIQERINEEVDKIKELKKNLKAVENEMKREAHEHELILTELRFLIEHYESIEKEFLFQNPSKRKINGKGDKE